MILPLTGVWWAMTPVSPIMRNRYPKMYEAVPEAVNDTDAMMACPDKLADVSDLQSHYDTYRGFVRWTAIFAAHVAVILVLLAYFTM